MKKTLLLAAVFLFATPGLYATTMLKITKMDSSVIVKTPNGETETYRNIDEIPELLYGSKITAGNGTAVIKLFNTATIILDKYQGIMITKNPVTREIEISKIETKETAKNKNAYIKVMLAGNISASFGSDTKVTVAEQFPSVFFGVKSGSAVVKGVEGSSYKIMPGDYYEAKQNLLE